MKQSPYIKIYKSYGSGNKATVIGHLFKSEPPDIKTGSNLALLNVASLLKMFSLDIVPDTLLQLEIMGETYFTKTEKDGFFKFELTLSQNAPQGWNSFKVNAINDDDFVIAVNYGQAYFPQKSKYIYISDIDDTIMKSYSATILKRLYELIRRNARKRRLFDNTAVFYNALSESNVDKGAFNPFFYVSSSEWNLYEYLNIVFHNHNLPNGIFLLNTLKQLSNFVKTGKSGHEGKLMRIARIMLTYTDGQEFILLGDNSQKDPEIYCAIADKYGDRIKAILIRNVVEEHKEKTDQSLSNLPAHIHRIQFKITQEAIAFSRAIGLIHDR